ncbi:MAG: BatD family protein, partial [Saprospiraceae bacterium]|nr:BatD family protein [Saprospiraceae bacterium]
SSMMQIINGSITSRQTYTYILAPKNPGKFYIEPAFANLKNGSVLETQAIEIVVKSNPDGIKQDRNRSNNSLEDMFRRPKTQKPAEKLKPERKTYKI